MIAPLIGSAFVFHLLKGPPAGAEQSATPATVRIVVSHSFGDRRVRLDDVSYRTLPGDTISFSRIDYLLSGVRLIDAAGAAHEFPPVAFVSEAAGRRSFDLEGVPCGRYTSILLDVGVPPGVNHSDPAARTTADPLHPLVNNLHWGWQGGYVFLALEGRYAQAGGGLGGYSFHIATDQHRVTARIPIDLEIGGDTAITLNFDLRGLFGTDGAGAPALGPDSNSTHSAPTDAIAGRISGSLAGAFSFVQSGPLARRPRREQIESLPALRAGLTPYEFAAPVLFPRPFLPPDNPLSLEGVELGRRLFFEKRLSGDATQSCADCHRPEAAYADPGRPRSVGIGGEAGDRNAMPLFNLAWNRQFTWDGRRARLRDQAVAPIQDAREMNQTLERAAGALADDPSYAASFEVIFGTPAIDGERIGLALEQFLLTLVSADSKYDRVRTGQERFTPQEQRGFDLFVTESDPARGKFGADCFHCHSGELFSDYQLRNNGLLGSSTDRGRANVTGRAADDSKFKVPSLRNVALTAPYMHDGRFGTLDEVIDHYISGVRASETLDPNLAKHGGAGLRLSPEDAAALKAFLETLTGSSYGARGK